MSAAKKGASPIPGSRKARQLAAAVLSVLAGEKTTSQASAMMKISLPRYYQLETRALEGMVKALEPRPAGGQKTPESEIRALTKENQRIRRELTRVQALVRAAHRSLGLRDPTQKGNGKPKRPSRKHNRAKKAIARMVKPGEEEPSPERTDE
ncbi:MAG: hypothetical protein ACYTGV_06385 [Planctomycetota bacterium]|jgi:hypothetical protein